MSPIHHPLHNGTIDNNNSSHGHNDTETNLFHRAKVLWSQLSLHELSGSAGDLGTFIPLFVALGRQRSIYVAPALFLAGLSNVLTGFLWDVPMPVQPMKTISALAIAQGLSRHQVTAAGMWMGGFMVALGSTNGIEWVNRIVPKSVVAGMQLGVGMSLAIHGIGKLLELPVVSDPDCILMALVAAVGTIYGLRPLAAAARDGGGSSTTRLPSPVGLYLLLVAGALGLFKFALQGVASSSSVDQADDEEGWAWEPVLTWTLFDISFKDWMVGFWEGAIPQLPLTTLNSVISVCALAHTLFPEKRQPEDDGDAEAQEGMAGESLDSVLSRREVAFSVGIMNLLACPLGGLPNCHGAGGLAGQHQLGARHGAAIVFLGSLKMILALTLGAAVMHMLDAFPVSILGVMLTMAGHELASTGLRLSLVNQTTTTTTGGCANRARSGSNATSVSSTASPEEDSLQPSPPPQTPPSDPSSPVDLKDRMAVALLTAIVVLGTKKTHYGALAGWVADCIYKWSRGTLRWNASWWTNRANRNYVEVRSIPTTAGTEATLVC